MISRCDKQYPGKINWLRDHVREIKAVRHWESDLKRLTNRLAAPSRGIVWHILLPPGVARCETRPLNDKPELHAVQDQ